MATSNVCALMYTSVNKRYVERLACAGTNIFDYNLFIQIVCQYYPTVFDVRTTHTYTAKPHYASMIYGKIQEMKIHNMNAWDYFDRETTQQSFTHICSFTPTETSWLIRHVCLSAKRLPRIWHKNNNNKSNKQPNGIWLRLPTQPTHRHTEALPFEYLSFSMFINMSFVFAYFFLLAINDGRNKRSQTTNKPFWHEFFPILFGEMRLEMAKFQFSEDDRDWYWIQRSVIDHCN